MSAHHPVDQNPDLNADELAPLGEGNYEAYADANLTPQANAGSPYAQAGGSPYSAALSSPYAASPYGQAATGSPYSQSLESLELSSQEAMLAGNAYDQLASPYAYLYQPWNAADPLAEIERQTALQLGHAFDGLPASIAGGQPAPISASPYNTLMTSSYSAGYGAPSEQANSPYSDAAPAQAARFTLPRAKAQKALRVIHVGECLVQAGIEQWLRNLIRYTDNRRIRITRCIATSPTVDPRVAAEMGVPVEIGQEKSIQRAALECDVLVVSGPGEVAAWLGAYRPKLCVFVAHGDARWTQDILRRSAPVIDHVVAVSESARRICHGFPCTIIPNGIDSLHVAQSRPRQLVRAQLGFNESDTVLGFVGRFSPEKRPQAIIEAVAGLPQEYKAMFVGWGGMRDALMSLANQMIPGRFAFAEATEHLGDYYHAMDCLCMPSVSEGFGLVIMEAMYCGTPVVAAPVGCATEVIVDRVNGIIAPHGADSLREAAQLLRNHKGWARSIAEEGRAFAQRHGHARDMAHRYEELLLGLWRAKQASPSRHERDGQDADSPRTSNVAL